MKKLCCTALAMLLCASLALPVGASYPNIGAVTAVLMDAKTGEILYDKEMSRLMYPASITKILTGLLVMESCNANEIATASADAVNIPKGYSHIALRAGDEISVDNAMYALMLASANDAANVLAEHVSGTQASFAALMNRRATELGAVNSNFENASGMPLKYHYTTAYDMALITRAAYRNPSFMHYFGAKSYHLPAVNSITLPVELKSYQFMLLEEKDEYNPDVIAGKIGYTRESGHTMSTVATKDGRTLICVVLNCTAQGKYTDTQRLLNYGFDLLAGGN